MISVVLDCLCDSIYVRKLNRGLVASVAFTMLAIPGCGYWWAAAYETEASLSYWGVADPAQAELIKKNINEFADREAFRQTLTIHSQLNANGSIFSVDLEKRKLRVSISNVPEGCVLNVGFYGARIDGLKDGELLHLGDEFVGLMNEAGVKLTSRAMTVEDDIPACDVDKLQ